MFFDVQSLLKRNPRIVNARPHHWHTLRRFAQEGEALVYLAEMRRGAREVALPYRYRVKATHAIYAERDRVAPELPL